MVKGTVEVRESEEVAAGKEVVVTERRHNENRRYRWYSPVRTRSARRDGVQYYRWSTSHHEALVNHLQINLHALLNESSPCR